MAEQEDWDYSSWASSRAAVMDAAKTQLNPSTMGMDRLVHLQMPYGRKPAEHQLTVAQDGEVSHHVGYFHISILLYLYF